MIALLKTHIPELTILIFLFITFGISVIEKCMDWKGTISYIQHNFQHTFIKKYITLLIFVLLCLEIVTSGFLVFGFYQLLDKGVTDMALVACTLSAICILYMLIGQRIAKDYVGATSLTVYLIITVFGMYLLN